MREYLIATSEGRVPVRALGDVRLTRVASDGTSLERVRHDALLNGRDELVLRAGGERYVVSAERLDFGGAELASGSRLQGWRGPDGSVGDAVVEHVDREPEARRGDIPAGPLTLLGMILSILLLA